MLHWLLCYLHTVSESEDDERSVEDEITSLIQQFGQDGTCYEDSRVIDMLDSDQIDPDNLLELLRCAKWDWIKDQARNHQGMSRYSFLSVLHLNRSIE